MERDPRQYTPSSQPLQYVPQQAGQPVTEPHFIPSEIERSSKESRSLISTPTVFYMVVIGLILFYVGLLLLSWMALVDPPDDDDYDSYDDYKKEREDYYDLLRNLLGFGRIFIVIGGLIESIALIGSGVGNTDQDSKIRGVSISAGIAFVIAVLVILNLFSSIY